MIRGQLTIPHEPGRKLDAIAAYAKEFGAKALARQQRLYAEENECNCASGTRRKGARFHKPGCPLMGKNPR